MYAQLTFFEGPRSPELIEAGNRATRERVIPAINACAELADQLVAAYELSQPDGGQVSVVIVKDRAALDIGRDVIMSTELLPGEDPVLLPGPDRVEIYQVTLVHNANHQVVFDELATRKMADR